MSDIDTRSRQMQIFQLMLPVLSGDWGKNSHNFERLPPSDWAQIVQMATRLGVANYLYYQIQHQPLVSFVPTVLIAELREAYRITAFNNLERYRELNRVLIVLKNAGITPIALKGIHVAQILFGNIALRSMNDIDLLVKKVDYPKAEKCLYELGYHLYDIRRSKKWYLDNHFHAIFNLSDKPIQIELHWNLVKPVSNYRVDIERLWQRSVLLQIAGVQIRTLSLEDLLVYLCVHVSHHSVYDLYAFRSFIDIHRLIELNRNRIDWDRLIDLVGEWRAVNTVFLTLRLTQRMLGTVLPVEVIDTLTPRRFEPCLLEWAEERVIEERIIVEAADDLNTNLAALLKRYDHTQLTHSLREKFLALANLIFIDKAEIAEIYALNIHAPTIYFYYLVRIAELLKRYSIPSVRLFLGDPNMKLWAEQGRKQVALAKFLTTR